MHMQVQQLQHQTISYLNQYRLTIVRKQSSIINMVIRVIIMITLICGLTAKKHHMFQNHKNQTIKNDWTSTLIRLGKQFQIEHPNTPKVIQKFVKTLNYEYKRKVNSYKYTKLSNADIKRANKLKNIVDEQSKQKLEEQYNIFQLKYNISKYDQLPFCIVVPSYQNVQNKRYQKNLISILQQNYTNYHVVYIDDASPDRTSDYVNKFLEKHPLKHKVEVIRNQNNVRQLENCVTAARKYCKPNQFYFRIDGDDYLIGRQVLKLFNAAHQQNNQTWVIYSNSIMSQDSLNVRLGYSRPFLQSVIKNNDYRYSTFRCFVQQSFYTQLFLRIKDQDLKNSKGQYYKNAGDAAYIFPILEMAGPKILYLPQITYYYNFNTGINQAAGKTMENHVNTYLELQHKQKYQKLEQILKPEDFPTKLKLPI